MAELELHSLVRSDAYRKATRTDVEFGPTWSDRHSLSLRTEGAENLPISREDAADTLRLSPAKVR